MTAGLGTPGVLTAGDPRPRWRPGERLHHLFDELVASHPDEIAVDTGAEQISFAELGRRSQVLARQLRDRGVRPGHRVALLPDSPVTGYVAMLAVGRLHAAYVPLDVGFPDDRIDYICGDAGVEVVVTAEALRERVPAGTEVVVAEPEGSVLRPDEAGEPVDELAYLIYTSGTTGRPKGVEIEHAAIYNFVRVAAECYGYRADDRVYQGMTLAFDFSVEELWVPWLCGATVVPKPASTTLVGEDLQDFLVEREVTAICCVPTLLATLDERALTGLRFLLVSGEACPQDLVTRWHRDGRRFLNVYGPTEATVTATWSAVHPDRPITLGVPLPTYTVLVLDPEHRDAPRTVPVGEPGELGIAGIGLARGYLDRPDLTEAAFVPDVFDLPDNPSGRIYRTGDLVRLTPDGEIEYHGRIDTQVKIRGYRIELTEIESVLLGVAGVAQACVDVWEPAAGISELVAYYSVRPGAAVDPDDLHDRLAERVPAYMVPAYYEQLDRIPLTSSDKADRKALPEPASARRTASGAAVVPPGDDTEQQLADTLQRLLGLTEVSVTADFFADLGATSLLMARYSALLREIGVRASIRDIYGAPTVRGLAAVLGSADVEVAPAEPVRPAHRARTSALVLTGVAQLALFAGYVWLLAAVLEVGYDLVGGTGVLAAVGRAVLLAALGVVLLAATPVAAKWLLVGRWREQEFPVWGLRYLRFWVVKTLVRSSVFVLFAGSPLYSMYLRALGARVGRRTVVLSRHVPIATDLISLGDDVVVRKDVWLNGYRAEGGRIRTGRVTVGDRGFVGEAAVLDIDTTVGTDAQLAHASSLHACQTVPAGESWHGSPGQPAPAGTDFRRVPIATPRPRRPLAAAAGFGQLLGVVVALTVGLLLGGLSYGTASFTSGPWGFVAEAVLGSAVLFFGALAVAGVAAFVLPRAARRLLRPDVDYPMHGPRMALHRAVVLISNRPLLVTLFGDSALITGYMRRLGWNLGTVEQTGSNFGTTHQHEWPYLSAVGTGTMISDGLSMANAEYSSTHFRLGAARIGDRNFLGNKIVYPAGGRTGDNVLLATKVMVPLHGDVRSDTGLLGSPAFEIPRSTGVDGRNGFQPDELTERLAAKRRHNVATMGLLLLSRWGQLAALTAVGLAGSLLHDRLGVLAYALAALLALPVSTLWFVAVERAALLGHKLFAHECSIYDPWFWRHERLWKLLTPALAVFDGTPFKPLVLRLLGVGVGKRLFDDGASMPEHTLATIGDDCTLNAGSTIQCHSLEDGAFKCDRTVLGDGVTVGVAGFVHYGVQLAENSVLDADAFLMKGSRTTPASRWRGNPAVALQ